MRDDASDNTSFRKEGKKERFRPILVILVLFAVIFGSVYVMQKMMASNLESKARQERARARQSRDEAVVAGAGTIARNAWKAANRTWREAESHFVFGRHDEAISTYETARSEFNSARKVAVAQAMLPEEERDQQEPPAVVPVQTSIPEIIADIERGLARGDRRGLSSADSALTELRREDSGNRRISGFQLQVSTLRSGLALESTKRANVTGIINRIERGLARDNADGLAAAQTALAELKRIDSGNSRISRFQLQMEPLHDHLVGESEKQAEIAQLVSLIESGLTEHTEAGFQQAKIQLAQLRQLDPGNSHISEFTSDLNARKLPPAQLIQGSSTAEQKTIEINPGLRMEFVWISPGSFMMGSPTSEKKRGDDEGPVHRVHISKGFWIGKYEVTQAVWESVIGRNPSQFKGSRRPVENVSWSDAQSFVAKLNGRISGRPFRLPTEAEWEYACRAGTTGPFNTGDCLSADQANYDGDRPYRGCYTGRDRQTTINVGTFSANAWGLYDMHGNVCEWCWDRYDEYYYEKSPGSDPQGPEGVDSGRVHRGGGWKAGGGGCRSAYRNGNSPDKRGTHLGFRLVRSPR